MHGEETGKELFLCNPSKSPDKSKSLNDAADKAAFPFSFANGLKCAAPLATQ